MAKPEGGLGDNPQAVEMERAAYVLACELGWAHMMNPTVIRKLRSPHTGSDVDVALTPFLDNVEDNPAFDRVDEEDLWKAAVFDYVIEHGDRSHNWLGISEGGQRLRLKLLDHGYAFGAGGRAMASAFVEAKRGQTLPDWVKSDLQHFLDTTDQDELRRLLGDQSAQRVRERAQALLSSGIVI